MSYREFNKQVQNLVVSKIFRTFATKSSNLEIMEIMARTRIKNPVVLTRIAQYAMYAYCIFALFSLAFSVCRQAGLSFRTSPILIPISPILVTIKQLVLQLAPLALWGIFRYTLPAGVKLLRRCSELMVLYYVLSFILGQCFNLHLVTMMQNGQITLMASILTWTESTMGLISVIASLVAGCHLCSKHRGNMRKLGIALVLVFMVWLICSNILPVAVFYLAGNTQQAAFTCMNLISMITTTSAYIYAYYRMFRAIERNLQYTANFTQKHKKFAMHCKFLEKVSYICSAFHF